MVTFRHLTREDYRALLDRELALRGGAPPGDALVEGFLDRCVAARAGARGFRRLLESEILPGPSGPGASS